ncbi:MAG: type II secretion system F family protein [Gammaproteobacteria bacterium]|nr:type II secretion system F family protein [Gammaproteobacteria bacterium]
MAINLNTNADNTNNDSASFSFNVDSINSLLEYGRTVTADDRTFFTEQLALLLETGVSLHSALEGIRNQVESPVFKKMLDGILKNISEGKTFSYALSQYPDVFSTTYVNLILASENGGFMHEVLQELLNMDEKSARLKSTISSAFSYPAFLMFFSLAVVVFVLVVVFPKFTDMFSQIHDQLPMSTKVLMMVSDVFINHWLVLIVSLSAIAALLVYLLKTPQGILLVDRVKLKAPVLKDVFIQLYLVQSLRVMSLSLGHGVSVTDTLESCKDVVKNSIYRAFIQGVSKEVNEGAGISSSFKNAPFMPALVQQMIATGEEAGNLPRVMSRVADHYEQALSKKLTALSKLAEPLMLMVMGLVVGILVSSLILPIFKLSRAVH